MSRGRRQLQKVEHCNLGEEVDSDVARKTSAANALMSERERSANCKTRPSAESESERERESEREKVFLGSKTRRKLQKFCTAKTSTTVDFN